MLDTGTALLVLAVESYMVMSDLEPLFIGHDILVGFLMSLIEAVATFIGTFLGKAAISFLTVKPPASYEAGVPVYVESAYSLKAKAFTIFPGLLILTVLFAIGTAPISNRNKTEPWRLFKRFITVMVMVIFFYPTFDLGLQLINDMIVYFAPETYRLDFVGPDYKNSLGQILTGSLSLVIGYLTFSSIGLLSVLAFIMATLARKFVIYITWAAFPVLACGWFFDFGPLKPIKGVVDTFFSTTLFLIGVGPFIALGLNLGASPPGSIGGGDPSVMDILTNFGFWALGLMMGTVAVAMAGKMALMSLNMGGGTPDGGGSSGGGGGGNGSPSGGTDGGGEGGEHIPTGGDPTETGSTGGASGTGSGGGKATTASGFVKGIASTSAGAVTSLAKKGGSKAKNGLRTGKTGKILSKGKKKTGQAKEGVKNKTKKKTHGTPGRKKAATFSSSMGRVGGSLGKKSASTGTKTLKKGAPAALKGANKGLKGGVAGGKYLANNLDRSFIGMAKDGFGYMKGKTGGKDGIKEKAKKADKAIASGIDVVRKAGGEISRSFDDNMEVDDTPYDKKRETVENINNRLDGNYSKDDFQELYSEGEDEGWMQTTPQNKASEVSVHIGKMKADNPNVSEEEVVKESKYNPA
ncbi:MAG: hypothetical protein ABEK59_04815 [Halobacteria archaeon]